MEIQILISSLIGPVILAVGLGMLINTDYYQNVLKNILKNPSLLILLSIVSLVVGVLIVSNYNIWSSDWTILITIIGWIALIRGVAGTILPNIIENICARIVENTTAITIFGIVKVIIGAILVYQAYLIV